MLNCRPSAGVYQDCDSSKRVTFARLINDYFRRSIYVQTRSATFHHGLSARTRCQPDEFYGMKSVDRQTQNGTNRLDLLGSCHNLEGIERGRF